MVFDGLPGGRWYLGVAGFGERGTETIDLPLYESHSS